MVCTVCISACTLFIVTISYENFKYTWNYGRYHTILNFVILNKLFGAFVILNFLSVESDDEYYYDDDISEEEEQLPNEPSFDDTSTGGNDLVGSFSSSPPRQNEDLLVTLRAQNAAVLEEIRMVEITVRDPVQRFKKIRDLAAKRRAIVYNIKKEENQNRNPGQRVSSDSPRVQAATAATTTTTPSTIDTRFKKIRDLTAKRRELVYNIKKEENQNRNPGQRVSSDGPRVQAATAAAAATTTTPSKIDR